VARLQFRLPDGSSVSQEFGANELLQAAYDFISQQVGTGVKLSTAYPRRTFTPDQMAMSFKDLQLAPSAAIIVVPVRTNSVIINKQKNKGNFYSAYSALLGGCTRWEQSVLPS
jgi:hypothetical protein